MAARAAEAGEIGSIDLSRLRGGGRRLGVELDDTALQRFAAFAQLLSEWSHRTNLLSCRSPAELVDRHFLDSLAVGPLVASFERIVDVGSGAGFPGVPLSILFPQKQVALLESRRRRATFLRIVKRALDLPGLLVLEGRAEDPVLRSTVPQFDVATCRAVWSGTEIFDAVSRWIRIGGNLLWMRGERATDPTPGTIALALERRVPYRVLSGAVQTIDLYTRKL